MANSKSAEQIVRESLPGVRIMPPLPSPAEDAVAESLPAGHSVVEMRQKYLGETATQAEAATQDREVVAPSDESARPRDLEAVRRRFLGPPTTSSVGLQGVQPMTGGDDVEIVRVQSRSQPEDAIEGPGVRTVIVSKSKGSILGKQG